MDLHLSILRTKAVALILKELNQKLVFVGGATVALYAPKEISLETRPTDDVDIVVELASDMDYSKLDEELRRLGFRNDIESGIICRYKIQGIIVDIMPTNSAVLGFSNIWYPEGFKNAIGVELDNETRFFLMPILLPQNWRHSKIEVVKIIEPVLTLKILFMYLKIVKV
jgi:hypothetical protein